MNKVLACIAAIVGFLFAGLLMSWLGFTDAEQMLRAWLFMSGGYISGVFSSIPE